jgi:Fe-S-cluster formation regulator IscX/YfhJ
MKKKLDTRSNDLLAKSMMTLEDFDDISNTIDEFYDSDKDDSDIADEVYHKISTDIDLRHLRCFSMKEITEQVECFCADMIEIDRLRKED